LGYIFADYTEKMKSRESFEDFKNKIYDEKYNKCIFYFDLNKAVSGIAEYYKDRFNVCDTSDHFLILYRYKWSIIENNTVLNEDTLKSLLDLDGVDGDTIKKKYLNKNTGKTDLIANHKKPIYLKQYSIGKGKNKMYFGEVC
jgi:hypothetical protein